MAISPVLAQAIMETAKGPDIMGQFQAGQEAGFQRQERERQVEVRDLLGQAYGGDEGALEQLGTLDPEKAFQLQNMFNTRDNQSTSQLFKDAVVARNLTGSARQQFMADRAKRILRSGGDPAQTLSIMEMSEGEQNATLDNLVTAGQASGVLPPAIKEEKRETKVIKNALVDVETGEEIYKAVADEEEISDLDKSKIKKIDAEIKKITEQTKEIQNKVPKEVKLTDVESKATGFYNRMISSEAEIDRILESNPDFDPAGIGERTASGIPIFGNILASPEYQQYKQAADDWIRSKLRRESGAVIGVEEMEKEYEIYFPKIGDSDAVIEQKRRARKTAEKAMQIGAGRGISKLEKQSDKTVSWEDL